MAWLKKRGPWRTHACRAADRPSARAPSAGRPCVRDQRALSQDTDGWQAKREQAPWRRMIPRGQMGSWRRCCPQTACPSKRSAQQVRGRACVRARRSLRPARARLLRPSRRRPWSASCCVLGRALPAKAMATAIKCRVPHDDRSSSSVACAGRQAASPWYWFGFACS